MKENGTNACVFVAAMQRNVLKRTEVATCAQAKPRGYEAHGAAGMKVFHVALCPPAIALSPLLRRVALALLRHPLCPTFLPACVLKLRTASKPIYLLAIAPLSQAVRAFLLAGASPFEAFGGTKFCEPSHTVVTPPPLPTGGIRAVVTIALPGSMHRRVSRRVRWSVRRRVRRSVRPNWFESRRRYSRVR